MFQRATYAKHTDYHSLAEIMSRIWVMIFLHYFLQATRPLDYLLYTATYHYERWRRLSHDAGYLYRLHYVLYFFWQLICWPVLPFEIIASTSWHVYNDWSIFEIKAWGTDFDKIDDFTLKCLSLSNFYM